MKMGERVELKGVTPCVEQDISLAWHRLKVLSGWCWSSEQNNNNNANNTNFPGGSTNNNDKNNSNIAVPVSDFNDTLELCLAAEEDCFENKKSKMDAAKFHYHLAEIIPLARSVHNGTYTPDGGICFIIKYPTLREVFCARYKDRIIHHLVAPYILSVTESVHIDNGDISHGNRIGHSSHTAAVQIQERMKLCPDGYVFKYDVKSFFMSICRKKALDVFRMYEDKFSPTGYTDDQRRFYMGLISTLILSNPTKGCELHSPLELHRSVPIGKSLFSSNEKGFPIGNLYSQLLAGLYLAPVDSVINTPHFVDDYGGAESSLSKVIETRHKFISSLETLGLEAHPKKMYVQPVSHGVAFCGRVIYKDRMYVSNRVVKACIWKINRYKSANLENARAVMRSVNSYTGMMCNTRSYNIQRKIAGIVLERFNTWLYFKNRHGHLVCTVKTKFKEKYISEQQIKHLDNYVKRLQHRA